MTSTPSQILIARIEAASGLPEDVLARRLLLPDDYDAKNEKHAVLPTVCIQLWIEAKAGDDEFSSEQLAQVERRFGPLPAVAQAPCEPAPPDSAPPEPTPLVAAVVAPLSEEDKARREAQWLRVRDVLSEHGVTRSVLKKLEFYKPWSFRKLTVMVLNGELRHAYPSLSARDEIDLARGLDIKNLPQARENWRERRARIAARIEADRAARAQRLKLAADRRAAAEAQQRAKAERKLANRIALQQRAVERHAAAKRTSPFEKLGIRDPFVL